MSVTSSGCFSPDPMRTVFNIDQTFSNIEAADFDNQEYEENLINETLDDNTISTNPQDYNNSIKIEFEDQKAYLIADNDSESPEEIIPQLHLQMQPHDDSNSQLETQLRNAAANQHERPSYMENNNSDSEDNMHWGFLQVELGETDQNIKFVQAGQSGVQDESKRFFNNVLRERTLIFMCDQDVCDFHTSYLDTFKRHCFEVHESNLDDETIFNNFVCMKIIYRYKTETVTDSDQCPTCSSHSFRRYKNADEEHNYCAALFECNRCQYQARRKTVWLKNSKSKFTKQGDVYKCSKCEYKRRLRGLLKLHYRKNHSKIPFELHECYLCRFRTESLTELIEHFRQKLYIDPDSTVFECSYRGCVYKTLQKKLLMIHFANHYYDGWYKCTFCNFKTGIIEKLSGHYVCYHGIDANYYECYRGCGYQTKQREQFLEHCKEVHEELAEWLECKICKVEFEACEMFKEHKCRPNMRINER